MQFIRVGGRIQVRAYRGYDREKKRSIMKTLGSLDPYNYSFSDGLTDEMSIEEKEELQDWIKTSKETEKINGRRATFTYIDTSLMNVARCIDAGECEDLLTEESSNRIYVAIDELQKTLRKAGFSRPKRKTAVQKKDDRQTEIFEKIEK